MAFRDLATQKHYEPTPKEKEAKAIHIFVDTDFKIANRAGTPIPVLAMTGNLRYIRELEYLIDKTFQEQTDEVSQIIRAHYAENEGKIPIWGEIKRYHYRYSADSLAIVFNIDGTVIGISSFTEPYAVLSIGGHDISPLLYTGR